MLDWIKSQISLSLLTSVARQLLTVAGTYLVARNWLTPDQAAQITGAGLVIVSAAWSFFSAKGKAEAVAVKKAVAASPIVDAVKTQSGATVIVPADGGHL